MSEEGGIHGKADDKKIEMGKERRSKESKICTKWETYRI
jgi:hypothetical protein